MKKLLDAKYTQTQKPSGNLKKMFQKKKEGPLVGSDEFAAQQVCSLIDKVDLLSEQESLEYQNVISKQKNKYKEYLKKQK